MSNNPWGIRFLRMFDMANDSGLFRTAAVLTAQGAVREGPNWRDADGNLWVPLIEAKMVHQFDHRWASYDATGEETRDLRLEEKQAPDFHIEPRYWVPEEQVRLKTSRAPKPVRKAWKDGNPDAVTLAVFTWLAGHAVERHGEDWEAQACGLFAEGGLALPDLEAGRDAIRESGPALNTEAPLTVADLDAIRNAGGSIGGVAWNLIASHAPNWLLGWRDVTRSTDARTAIACIVPRQGVNDKFLLMFPSVGARRTAALYGCMNSLVFDYVCRQKLSGTALKYFVLKQIACQPPSVLADETALGFITPRVLELTYTTHDLAPFARDLGYGGAPFPWGPERRALLRAELDAYYAYLYGLTRRDLNFILDPADVMGADYPTETFRVLKESEERQFGEYRTKRLVLAAWDRFVESGTFDPLRLRGPESAEAMRRNLVVVRGRVEELEQVLAQLVSTVDAQSKPTLFVEGASDVPVVEAAWSVFFPDDPLPFAVVSAGGTKQMQSLAAPGKALRDLLHGRLVLALADNDGEGRNLWTDGHLHKGGVWKAQTNGVHICLLKPTDAFRATMERFNVPKANWPFTVETAFPVAIRRQAEAEGAYAVSDDGQPDLFNNPELARRIAGVVARPPDDDARFDLRAPHPDYKERFAAWVTRPERRTREVFAAFETIVTGLNDLLARTAPATATPAARRGRGAA